MFKVILDTGARLPYDYLVLATGSRYADSLSSGTSPSEAERRAEIKARHSLILLPFKRSHVAHTNSHMI